MVRLFFIFFSVLPFSSTMAQENTKPVMTHEMTEIWNPEVPVIKPGKEISEAPSDALLLFNGNDINKEWMSSKDGGEVGWTVSDGIITVVSGKGDIRTKREFNDFQLHLEWRTPIAVVDSGMRRGNSGVFLQGIYEVQILDSYNNRTCSNGQAGSIYKQHAPLVNVCKGPGEWQIFDIIYAAPRFRENGTYYTPPYVTIIQNGVLVQNHIALRGPTMYIGIPEYNIKPHGEGPVILQDHWFPVSFRNIWIREL